jgi:Fe-S cluster assembly protein SufD
VATTQVSQQTKSVYHNSTITLSGALVRNNLNVSLDGEYCELFMNGLYMLNGTTHVDNHTVADHRLPNSQSHELYKGILDEKSSGVFNGKIFVRQDAQKTNAYQSNKNILLSDTATMNTKPQLEIWADDVKCSHGTTTGALDEEPLFYLMARGISRQKAKSLLMYAFADDVLNKIKIEAVRALTEKIISDRISL